MGFYLNPGHCEKEQYLEQFGLELDKAPGSMGDMPDGHLPICLTCHQGFTSAAVICDEEDLAHFNTPGDPRPKKWFCMAIMDIIPVTAAGFRRIAEEYGLRLEG